MKKNCLTKMICALMLGLFGIANASAQFLANTKTVDIVEIPAWDDGGKKAQRYLADTESAVVFSLEQNEASQWYRIPAGAVNNGTEDVQAYYYKNVATGKYLGITDATVAQLITERDGDWPLEAVASFAANDKSLGLKWFERPSNWPWGIFLSNAAGIDLTAKENNQIFCLTSAIVMKNAETEEFFGVYFPNATVNGFAGGGGNAFTAVKNPVVLESGVDNPDYFQENVAKIDIVEIPAWDDGGKKAQRYLADTETAVVFSLEQNEASQWYKIPAGAVSNGTSDVQAYYYKNVATGKYLGITDATVAQLITERDGDWPLEAVASFAANDKSLGLKWFERPSNWPWGIFLSNAAGIDLTAKENNQIFCLTSAIVMKNAETEEFFGVYFPNATVNGFAGGGGNAFTAVKNPVVVESGVDNPDYFPENPARIDIIQFPAWDDGGKKEQRYLADTGTAVIFSLEQNEASQWYKIPAGAVSDGTTDVQAYYYKNVATGKYLGITDATVAQLITERDGDWPLEAAASFAVNDKSLGLKWFERPSNWPWGIFLSNAAGIDLTAKENNQIFCLTSAIVMKNAETEEFFGVYFPNATVNGFAGGGGNAFTAIKNPVVVESGATNPDYDGPVLELELSLDDVIVFDGAPDNSYDAGTKTITFNKDWNNVGWNVEGLDLSNYNRVTVEFEGAQAGTVRILSLYSEGNGVEFLTNNPASITNTLDVERIDKITRITLAVNGTDAGPRQLVLKRAYFWYEAPLKYDVKALNFFENSSYDASTHTATYKGDWQRVGWNFESQGGLEVPAQYDQMFLDIDASGLPATDEGPGRAKLQFDVAYMDGTTASSGGGWEGGNEYRADATQVWWNLDAGKKIKLVTLKSQVAGDVILKKAYFFTRPADPVDLTVTSLRWEPANPAPGDSVTFFATIKNIDENFASTADTKHGVVFQVNGTTATWSDAFQGPLAAGDSIELSSRMENSTGTLWVCGASQTYSITAWVNDGKNVKETNYDNNTLTKVLTVEGDIDLAVTDLTWNATDLAPGKTMTFSLKVQNIGTINTPANTDKKVKFYVNGEVVTWYENYTATLNAGTEPISISANSNEKGKGNTQRFGMWTIPANGKYTIKAEVNGDKSIAEGDYTNNFVEKTIQVGPNAIDDVSVNGGNVYINDGTLYLVNYPTASVRIHGLLGQNVAAYDAVSDKVDVNLSSGVYVVEVQFAGKVFTHKVIVK